MVLSLRLGDEAAARRALDGLDAQAARGLSPAEAHLALEKLYMDELMQTRDANEGLRSFLEKRRPDWSHA